MGLTSSLGYLYFSSDSNSYNPSIDNGFALFQGKARFPTGGIHRIEFDYLTTLSSQIAAGVGSLEDEGVQWSQQTLSYFFKTSQERFSLFVGSLIREDVLWSERQTKTIYGQTRTQAGLTSRWLIRNTSALEECLDFSLIPWGRRENIDQQGMETELTWNRQGTAENGQAWTFGLGFSRGEWRSLQQSWTQTKSFIHLGLSWSSF